jgi:hypothetical protein
MEQSLSAAGKEVLIKVVAQAVPTYSMACFKLPKGLCNHINGLIRSFWWGSKEGKRKTCWVAWEDMTKPEKWGGMGFRDIELFNLALLAHQAWRLLQDPSSLSVRVLKAVYFPEKDFLEADIRPSPSQVWREIVEGKGILRQGITRRIGTGEETEIWNMNWLPRNGLFRPLSGACVSAPQKVSELIDSTTMTWDQQKLHTFLCPFGYGSDQQHPAKHEETTRLLGLTLQKKGCLLSEIDLSDAGENKGKCYSLVRRTSWKFRYEG